MNNLLAQLNIAPDGGFKGLGTGPLAEPGDNAVPLFAGLISSAIGLLTIIAIIWFVFVFITGAIGMMTAGADKQAVEGAWKKITSGLIGLTVIVSGIAVISLVGYLLGFNTVSGGILNLEGMFELLTF